MGEGSFISHINTKLFQNLQRDNVNQFSTESIGLYSVSIQGENWKISFGYSYSQNIQVFHFVSLKDESYKVVKEMY